MTSPVLVPEFVPLVILPAKVMPLVPGVMVAIPAVFGALNCQLLRSPDVKAYPVAIEFSSMLIPELDPEPTPPAQ